MSLRIPDIKSLPAEEIDGLLPADILKFKTTPLHHQKASLVWAVLAGKRVAFWHDIGVGKSLIALYLNAVRGTAKTLIVCPNSVVESWGEQIGKHLPQPHILLGGRTEDRKRIILSNGTGLFISSYNGLQYIFGHRVPHGKGTRWIMDYKTIRNAGFDSMIFDESHHLKNPKALQTMVSVELSKLAKYVVCMTGTPISLSEEDLFSQYFVLDGGRTLGASKWRFLSEHFDSVVHHYRNRKVTEWKIKPEGWKNILDRVAPVTLRYSREECFDLPDKVFEERRCDMTPEQRMLTQKIIDGIGVEMAEGQLKPQDVLHAGSKLAQVAGGLIILDKGQTKLLKKNPKLDLLMESLGEMRGKVIIFHSFVGEGRAIEGRLRNGNIAYASLRGEVLDKQTEINRFDSNPFCRVLVAT